MARDYSTDAGVLVQQIKIDDKNYYPSSVLAKLGYKLNEDSAVELLLSAGVTEKIEQTTTVAPANVAGLFYRIGSLHTRRFRTFLLAGASLVTLDITESGASVQRREYGSLSFGVGAEERLRSFKDASFGLSYLRFYQQENVALRGISAGFRVDFR